MARPLSRVLSMLVTSLTPVLLTPKIARCYLDTQSLSLHFFPTPLYMSKFKQFTSLSTTSIVSAPQNQQVSPLVPCHLMAACPRAIDPVSWPTCSPSPKLLDALIPHTERDSGNTYFVINKCRDLRMNMTSVRSVAPTFHLHTICCPLKAVQVRSR